MIYSIMHGYWLKYLVNLVEYVLFFGYWIWLKWIKGDCWALSAILFFFDFETQADIPRAWNDQIWIEFDQMYIFGRTL